MERLKPPPGFSIEVEKEIGGGMLVLTDNRTTPPKEIKSIYVENNEAKITTDWNMLVNELITAQSALSGFYAKNKPEVPEGFSIEIVQEGSEIKLRLFDERDKSRRRETKHATSKANAESISQKYNEMILGLLTDLEAIAEHRGEESLSQKYNEMIRALLVELETIARHSEKETSKKRAYN